MKTEIFTLVRNLDSVLSQEISSVDPLGNKPPKRAIVAYLKTILKCSFTSNLCNEPMTNYYW